MAKFVYPYSTLQAAINDHFSKAGGAEKAWIDLKQGYYNRSFRDERNKLVKEIVSRAKAAGLDKDEMTASAAVRAAAKK